MIHVPEVDHSHSSMCVVRGNKPMYEIRAVTMFVHFEADELQFLCVCSSSWKMCMNVPVVVLSWWSLFVVRENSPNCDEENHLNLIDLQVNAAA